MKIKMTFLLKWQLGFVIASVFAGCKMGPDYHAPTPPMPAAYSQAGAVQQGSSNTAVETQAVMWWKLFNDPLLDQLIDEARMHNIDLRLAQARVLEARAMYRVARSQLFPEVNLDADYSRSRSSANSLQGNQLRGAGQSLTQSRWKAGLDTSWELDVFGGVQRGLEAAHASVQATDETVLGTQVAVFAEVGRTYLERCGLQKLLAVAQESLSTQKQTLGLIQDRFKAGLANALDQTRAEAQVRTTAATIPPYEQGILRAEHRLAILLGRTPSTISDWLTTNTIIPSAAKLVPIGLPSDLLRNRPDLRRAERELAAATARIGVAVSEWFPKFYLTGAAGVESVDATDLVKSGSSFWSLGPTLHWPIFNAGRIQQQVRVENSRQQQALLKYEALVLGALEEVENALISYGKEQVRFESLAASEKFSRRAMILARDQFQGGLADYLHVLDAERSLQAVQIQLTQSELSLAQTVVILYQSLGGGWQASWEIYPSKAASMLESSNLPPTH